MDSLLTQLSVIAVGYGVLLTLVALFAVLRWRARPPWLVQLVWMLEFLMTLRLLGGLAAIAAGHRPDELTTNVGYLVASVCIMPIALGSVDEDEGVWSLGVIAVAALATTVVGVRLMMTT